MKFTVHTMEYAGGRAETSLDLRNYQDSDYEEYRTMYNGCFLAMRTALGLQPADAAPAGKSWPGDSQRSGSWRSPEPWLGRWPFMGMRSTIWW